MTYPQRHFRRLTIEAAPRATTVFSTSNLQVELHFLSN